MEDVEYISADKENNNEELISTYTCLLLYIQFTYKLTASIFTAVASEDVPEDIKFDMWEEVDSYFDEYGVRNGFAIIKYRMERNSKGQVHKRTLICEFGGKYKSKKKDEAKLKGTQRNTKTKKLGCPWHINLTFPENATQISVTTFINQHNHSLIPKTQEFATKYRSFNNDNRLTRLLWISPDQVELWLKYHDVVINDNTTRTNQYQLPLASDETLDTHVWILKCIRRATEQPPIVMFTDADPALDAANSNSAHSYVNHYSSKDGTDYLMIIQWQKIISYVPWIKSLNHGLGLIFIKSLQPALKVTARVEGYNWIIKQQLKAKSTLCELADRIDSRLKEEERWNQFHEYKQSTTTNTTSTSGQDLFPIKYLQCLFVNAIMIEPNNEELSGEQENPDKASDGFIEDQHDARFITLQTMIEEVGQERVLEIWKVVDIRSEKRQYIHFVIIVNTVSYLCSCLKSISKGIICRHYFRVMMNSKIAAFYISMIPQRWYRIYTKVIRFARKKLFGVYNNELQYEDYIRRKSNQEVDESSTASTIAAITESSSPSISTIDERSAINERIYH
ncbi:unnamed protein product [Rhizophagus irregularis]|nr:unnamed protein product [Rhizophagus irregularis]